LRIVATDFDDDVLGRAQRGCYEAGSLRELPGEWRDRAFDRRGKLLCVREDLRDGIEFRHEDLRERMPDGPLHLVLCRYLAFTYFDEPTQSALASRIAERMVPGGVLVVGTHEKVPADVARLEPLTAGAHAYRARG
jgi:chemotaxis protein methyltransferase CheR